MGGKTTKTEFQQRDPWKPAQPALNEALSGAMNAYNTTYQGPGVASMDPLVTQAQNSIIGNANTGNLSAMGQQAGSNFADILRNGGLSSLQSGAVGGIKNALGDYQGQMGQLASYLTPYASGQYMGQKNPYFDQALGDAMSSASDAANRQFSAAGRYGSGAHSGALGSSLGKIATQANLAEYQNQQNNMFNAINSLTGMANSGFGNTMAGQAALSTLGQQGISNTGSIASLMPTIQSAQNIDAQSLANIGASRMDYQQQLIDAANQNPWTRVGNLAQLAGGIGGLGGTSYGQSTSSSDPGVAGIIGGVMSGAGALGNLSKGIGSFSSLFSGLGGAGGAAGASGAAAGGVSSIMSALGPLMAFSDERLKENKKVVGATFDGQPIHAYNYIGDPTPRMGLMAQEVMQRRPDAVKVHDSGYYMVDYGKALENA